MTRVLPEPVVMVVDHVYRPQAHNRTGCAFMNCRRPRDEHSRTVHGWRWR